MSIHIYPTHCGVDPSGSEISTTDSLIQEFQEFEAQVYSGALFDQNCRTSTPLTENKNCLPSQTMNIPTIKLDPCLRETCTNQRLEGKRETNGMSDIEVDSLDDEPANPEAQNSMISKTPVHTDSQCKSNNSPDYRAKLSRIPQLIRSPNKVTSQPTISNSLEVKNTANISTASSQHNLSSHSEIVVSHSTNSSMPNCSITNNSPCFSTSDLGSTKSSSRRNQYFVPNLLTPSDMTKNRKFQLKATQSAVLPPNQSTSSNNLMNNPTHCSTNRVQVTVKKLTTPSSPSIHSADSCSQMNRINLDSVASYAQADPIETHDLVVAKMAADGVVWIPSSNTINSTTTELGDHRSILPKTDQLRWYSEEIEEEKVKNDSMVKRNSIPQSHDSTKHDSSATQNGLPRSNSLTGNQSVSMHSPSSSCNPSSSRQKASCQSNSNSTNSQSGSTESSTKQCELEAKLEEAMIIRKQQDDYIKQLQMYYDNLLTKHALAEVTIDQLRMGMRVGIDVNDADIPRNTLNKPRSHSMQTLHYNHKIISDENCTQANGYQNENNSNKNTTTTTVHYSSTPLLEQQRNRMKRNSSVHDERILSTTSESWETGLGSISNSSQMVQHSNISNTNTLSNGRKSSCSQDHTVVNENMHTNLSDQNNYRKISDPSPSRTSLHYGHSDDQIQKSNSCRRNTTTTSSFGIKQQQHMDIQTSASRNNSFTESEPRHDEDVGDEVIINEEVIDITPTNMYGSPNHEQPTLKKDQIQIADNVVTDFPDFTTVSPSTNTNSHLNDMICGPEAVQMELLLRVADLQTRLSTLELFATQHHFIQESDLMTIQLDYGTLKNFYDLAKIRWANDSYFDANKVLICELDHIGDQLNKLGSYATEAVLSPSSSNSSSPAPLPPHQPASVSDLPTNWRDLNIFKLSDQTSSSEHKPVKNTTDSGVLSSPSSLPSRSEHGRLSSISPLQSPIVEDSLSELESVYFELMQHYNKIKQLPMTSVRAEQLYNLMKRLYDLALTAENRSSIIASPEELERIFQLDGDTRKLSENLERAIALQKQLSSYQNFPSCESNSSSHEEVILQPGEIINVKANDHKDNGSNKLSSSFTRRGGLQTNKKNSIHSQLFTSQDSSSNQDSGLSTPPESSDGTKQEHDESNHQNNLHLSSHHHRHRLLPPQKTSSNVSNNNNNNNNNNKNSQTENSFGAQKHSHSDSGFDVCSQTVQLQKQSVYGEHKKSSINICPVEIKHEDKKDISKRSPNCYSPTHSYSPSTKQRIDALEDGVRLLKENLENFCLKTGNSPPIIELENLKSVCQQNIHQFASSSSNSHNSLPFSGVNRSDVIAFPYFSASSPFMNSNNGSGNHPFLPAGQPNFTYPYNDTVDIPMSKTEVSNESKYNPRSRQEICEDVVQHNSDFKNTAPRPCRTYHRTLDRRLIYTQQNDSSYSSSSPKTQNVGKQCMKSKQNRYVARDLSNTTRKISHNSGNIRDFSCSREANRHSQPNKSETHYSSNSMRGRSAKYYSTYQLNKQRDSSTSSISSECSTEDSPTLGSHTSSSENSSLIDDHSKLPHSSRCKLKGGSSIPKSRLHVDHLRNPVTKSILRDDKLKSHEKTHRSSSLCKPESYRAPLRSVTNTHCNYGSLNHLNCLPLNKTGISGDTPYLKPVHKLMNSFGGSVPVVADPEASFESVYLHQPVQQQSSRVYTAFENIQRKPQVSLKPSVYFYPSTERILYSQPIQTSSEQYANHNHDGVLFSARIPNNVNNTTTVCPKTMTCGACGGSGQVLESCNIGNFVNTRFIEPPLIRPTIGLNPLYRKTLSSARTKESRARPLRATHPCDISFVQCPSNLFENENIGRNFTPNFSVNPSTHYHPSSDRTEHPSRFGSLSRVNKRCQLKHLNSSNHAYIPSVHSSKRSQHLTDNINYNSKNNIHHIANTYSLEDSGSGTTSDEKLRSRKQMIRTNEHHHHHHHPNSEENSSWQSTPASNPHLSSLSALQEILKTASSTSRLAQKLRCSLEDLCKPN